MKVKYLAHASFLITSDSGTRIVTDPYTEGGPVGYRAISETADVVTVSHGHGDHNNTAAVKGNPTVLKLAGTAQAKGITFKGVAAFHDTSGGSERGTDVVFCFNVDGVRVCHLGDLGHDLTKEQIAEVGPVDVLLVPVGGTYTVDAAVASSVWSKLNPRVTIPMHYKTAKLGYPLAGVDKFLEGKKNVRKADGSEVEFKVGDLPSGEIVVLKPALL